MSAALAIGSATFAVWFAYRLGQLRRRTFDDDLHHVARHDRTMTALGCATGNHRLRPVSQPLGAHLPYKWRCADCPAVWTEHPTAS